jgi:hypothetical protein
MRKAIVFALLVAPVLGDDAQTAFDALKKEYDAAVQEFLRPMREAQAKGEKHQLDPAKHPSMTYVQKFADLAKQNPKTEAAAQALVTVFQMTRDKAARDDVAAMLLRDHVGSAAIKPLIGTSLSAADLRTIVEKSPHAEIRAFALLQLADTTARAGNETEALPLFKEAKQKYADVPWWRGTVGQRADDGIFGIEILGLGKQAPEIEGEDIDGKPMKLSDFKGKVVVLDFWGDW